MPLAEACYKLLILRTFPFVARGGDSCGGCNDAGPCRQRNQLRRVLKRRPRRGEKGGLKKQRNLQGKGAVDKNSGTALLDPVSVLLATCLAAARFNLQFLSSPQGIPLFSDTDGFWLA